MVGAADTSSQLNAWAPAMRSASSGDCGPATAAWLLNEHGPALYRSRSPETCASVRSTLMQAWRDLLRSDASGDESKAFVQQRLEQVPQALVEETLEGQVNLTLKALLRGEDQAEADAQLPSQTDQTEGTRENSDGEGEDAKHPAVLPYWFLPTDWARLAEAYQVDFVLHGLPGTEQCRCSHCDCSGHVHVGPRSPGTDILLHVGWRGVRKKHNADGANQLKERSNTWGHWEPLGSGPIKAPLQRQKSTLDTDLDFNGPCRHEQASFDWDQDHTTQNGSDNTVLGDLIVGWAKAGFNCVYMTSCTCQPAVCQQNNTCPNSRPCPKLKDCCDTDRRVSDDSVADLRDGAPSGKEGAQTPSKKPQGVQTSSIFGTQRVTPAPTFSGRSNGSGSGARFSVLLEGQNLFEGLDFEDNSPLRQADAAAGGSAGVAELERFKGVFLEAIAVAAGISRSRVHILDIGLPLEERMKIRMQRLAAGKRLTSPTIVARTCSPPREPDTGAGVLRFLTDDREAPIADSALSPAPDAATTPNTVRSCASSPAPATPPPTTTATPWNTPGDDRLTPPRPEHPLQARDADARSDKGSDKDVNTNAEKTSSVVRILAVLREPQPGDPCAEEPDAMMALELAVAELANSRSTLQQGLRNALDGRATRIMCPEAEGPCKGPHRIATAARNRAKGNAAALSDNVRFRHARCLRP